MWRNSTVVFLFTITGAVAATEVISYEVKSGDTFTTILQRASLVPIYGPNGSWKKMLELNPELQPDKGHKILPGQMVQFKVIKPDIPERAPTSKEEVLSEKPQILGSEIFSEFTIGAIGSYERLDATDEGTGDEAKLLSRMNPGLTLGWRIYGLKKLEPFLLLQIQKVSFNDFDSDHPIKLKTTTRTSLRAGSDWKFTPSFRLTTSLGYMESPFIRSLDENIYQVDMPGVFHGDVGVRYNFFERSNFEMGSSALLSYYGGNSLPQYKVKAGYGLKLDLHWKQYADSQKKSFVYGELFYQNRRQDSSIHKANFSNVGLLLQYGWVFGHE